MNVLLDTTKTIRFIAACKKVTPVEVTPVEVQKQGNDLSLFNYMQVILPWGSPETTELELDRCPFKTVRGNLFKCKYLLRYSSALASIAS